MSCPYCGSNDTQAVFGGFTCRVCNGNWKPMMAGTRHQNPSVVYSNADQYLEGTR